MWVKSWLLHRNAMRKRLTTVKFKMLTPPEKVPSKMTDILKVMDLMLNCPLMASIRRRHVEGLFIMFQSGEISTFGRTSCK